MTHPLTSDEKKVWVAAYAAAYVSDFTELRKLAEELGPRNRNPSTYYPFDEAKLHTNAEYAMAVANVAVAKLRAWEFIEGAKDIPIDVYPEEEGTP